MTRVDPPGRSTACSGGRQCSSSTDDVSNGHGNRIKLTLCCAPSQMSTPSKPSRQLWPHARSSLSVLGGATSSSCVGGVVTNAVGVTMPSFDGMLRCLAAIAFRFAFTFLALIVRVLPLVTGVASAGSCRRDTSERSSPGCARCRAVAASPACGSCDRRARSADRGLVVSCGSPPARS